MSSNPFSFLNPPPVLIVGSGPTGLITSLWLHRFGIPHRLIDRASSPGLTSRAMVVHARVLEYYAQLGLADRLVEAGTKVDGLVLTTGGTKLGKLAFSTGAVGLSPFPYVLSLPQDAHEQILNDALAERGLEIERGIELVDIKESEDSVNCTLRNISTGSEEQFSASYVLGADGAHSRVRHAAGIAMGGGTYTSRFYVADVNLSSTLPAANSLNMNVSERDFCMVVPLEGTGHGRLIGFVPSDKQDSKGNLIDEREVTFSDVENSVSAAAPTVKIESVRWFSTYRVHHRIADAFRSTYIDADSKRRPHPGRLFIAGDAAHLHSPVGGQGMNTGLSDASNIAWKIASVWKGTGPTSLLDTYGEERVPFARKLVNTTDQWFTLFTNLGWIGWLVRNFLMPYIMPLVWRIGGIKLARLAYVTVGQLAVHYPESALSEDPTAYEARRAGGKVKAGDRLPWIESAVADRSKGEKEGATSNFAPLKACDWQVHVYGVIAKPLEQTLYDRGVSLHVFPYNAEMAEKGLAKDAAYIVRPDGYVGMACRQEDTMPLERYLEKWGIGVRN